MKRPYNGVREAARIEARAVQAARAERETAADREAQRRIREARLARIARGA